jgi:hypothetical protein
VKAFLQIVWVEKLGPISQSFIISLTNGRAKYWTLHRTSDNCLLQSAGYQDPWTYKGTGEGLQEAVCASLIEHLPQVWHPARQKHNKEMVVIKTAGTEEKQKALFLCQSFELQSQGVSDLKCQTILVAKNPLHLLVTQRSESESSPMVTFPWRSLVSSSDTLNIFMTMHNSSYQKSEDVVCGLTIHTYCFSSALPFLTITAQYHLHQVESSKLPICEIQPQLLCCSLLNREQSSSFLELYRFN